MTVHTWTSSLGHIAAYFARPTIETGLAGSLASSLLQPQPDIVWDILLLINRIHFALICSLESGESLG